MGLFDLKKLLLFYGIFSITCASQSFTYKDTVFTGPVIKTIQNIDWFQCLELCSSTPECLSYNFCTSTRNTGVCELNKCGVDAVKCGQNKALRYQQHCVFHHFKNNQPRLAECMVSHQNQHKDSMGNFTCSATISIYADGNPTHMITREGQSKPVARLQCPSMNYPPLTLHLPRDTQVISIQVYQSHSDDDSAGAAIIGGFSDGLVTSREWKCAKSAVGDEWRLPSFNDSFWPYAKVIHPERDDGEEDNRHVGIPANAKWITYAHSSRRSLICRIKRKL